jgi:hypothetical protein
MAQNMRRDVLGREGRATLGRVGHVLGEQPSDGVGTQRSAAPGGKQWIGGVAGSFT